MLNLFLLRALDFYNSDVWLFESFVPLLWRQMSDKFPLFDIIVWYWNRWHLYMYEVKGYKVFGLFFFVPKYVPVWDFMSVEEQIKQRKSGRKHTYGPWRGAVHARRIYVHAQSSNSDGNLLPWRKPSKGCFRLFPQSWLFLQSGDEGKCVWLGFDQLSK